MINPVVDKFVLEFSSNFFDTTFAKKYNNYLFHKNYPIKDIMNHVHSNFNNISIPGFNIVGNNVNGLSNLGKTTIGIPPKNMTETSVNRQYAGTQPLDELFTSKTITISNKSTILNYMYYYEYFRAYYDRTRTVGDFKMFMTVMDQAEIPMMQFIFSDCFLQNIPEVMFETSDIVKETKTFDLTIAFNKFDTKLIIPEFDVKEVNL